MAVCLDVETDRLPTRVNLSLGSVSFESDVNHTEIAFEVLSLATIRLNCLRYPTKRSTMFRIR